MLGRLQGEQPARIKWCLSPHRNDPAQSFAARKKEKAGQFARELMEPLREGSRNAATLKKHKISSDSLMFQIDLQLGLLDILISRSRELIFCVENYPS